MPRRVAHPWAKAATKLAAKLGTDYRNHQMLANPWLRAAHVMVQIWRNIASQGRLNYIPPSKRRPTTWSEAADRMKTDLYVRKQCRLLDRTTWRFWATHLPKVHLRYIPKRNRIVPPDQ